MILRSFKFLTPHWSVDNLSLSEFNLIVGKNSVGKSRTLKALEQVLDIISQKKSITLFSDFSSEIELSDGQKFISLQFSIENRVVKSEVLKINGDIIISRNFDEAFIENEQVFPPKDMLLFHVRRDVKRYPLIETLIKWSESAIMHSFTFDGKNSREELFDAVANFTPKMKKQFLQMAKKVDFPITDIDTLDKVVMSLDNKIVKGVSDIDQLKVLMLRENKVGILFLEDLSSGMYRTIQLLVLLVQLSNLNFPSLIAIDDLGEGLDYSRSSKLGRILLDECKKYGIQLIATSNEEIMMNIFDISCWNILVRNGNIVYSISNETYPEVFEDFSFMGLSNFDFFTSDMLDRVEKKIFLKKQ